MFKDTQFAAASLLVIAGLTAPNLARAQSDIAAQHRQCERELVAASEAVGEAFAARDLQRFMAPFLDDAIQVNTLGEVFDGKPAVTEFYRAVMANNYTFSNIVLSRRVDGCNTATVVDRVVFAIPGTSVQFYAIDVASWIRVRGQWRLRADTTTRVARP